LPVADDADVLDIVTQLYKGEPCSGATETPRGPCAEICRCGRGPSSLESSNNPRRVP